MDIHDWRGVMTAVMILTFLGIFAWTFAGRRERFSEAAHLPFADDEAEAPPSRPEADEREREPR